MVLHKSPLTRAGAMLLARKIKIEKLKIEWLLLWLVSVRRGGCARLIRRIQRIIGLRRLNGCGGGILVGEQHNRRRRFAVHRLDAKTQNRKARSQIVVVSRRRRGRVFKKKFAFKLNGFFNVLTAGFAPHAPDADSSQT